MKKPDSLLITDEAMLLLTFGDCKILVNTEENHYKFWTYRVDLNGKATFYWGRIGKVVQEIEKEYGSKYKAVCEAEDKARAKLRDGYRILEES